MERQKHDPIGPHLRKKVHPNHRLRLRTLSHFLGLILPRPFSPTDARTRRTLLLLQKGNRWHDLRCHLPRTCSLLRRSYGQIAFSLSPRRLRHWGSRTLIRPAFLKEIIQSH